MKRTSIVIGLAAGILLTVWPATGQQQKQYGAGAEVPPSWALLLHARHEAADPGRQQQHHRAADDAVPEDLAEQARQ